MLSERNSEIANLFFHFSFFSLCLFLSSPGISLLTASERRDTDTDRERKAPPQAPLSLSKKDERDDGGRPRRRRSSRWRRRRTDAQAAPPRRFRFFFFPVVAQAAALPADQRALSGRPGPGGGGQEGGRARTGGGRRGRARSRTDRCLEETVNLLSLDDLDGASCCPRSLRRRLCPRAAPARPLAGAQGKRRERRPGRNREGPRRMEGRGRGKKKGFFPFSSTSFSFSPPSFFRSLAHHSPPSSSSLALPPFPPSRAPPRRPPAPASRTSSTPPRPLPGGTRASGPSAAGAPPRPRPSPPSRARWRGGWGSPRARPRWAGGPGNPCPREGAGPRRRRSGRSGPRGCGGFAVRRRIIFFSLSLFSLPCFLFSFSLKRKGKTLSYRSFQNEKRKITIEQRSATSPSRRRGTLPPRQQQQQRKQRLLPPPTPPRLWRNHQQQQQKRQAKPPPPPQQQQKRNLLPPPPPPQRLARPRECSPGSSSSSTRTSRQERV